MLNYVKLVALSFCLVVTLSFPLGAQAAPKTLPTVKIETNMGNIVVELDAVKAPITTQNFLNYVESGHYEDTIFHRVIRNFMIQGGGLMSDMKDKATRAPIRNEANNGLHNRKYTIAMARTSDPHSATAQFFINTANNTFLDHRGQTEQDWAN
ncbi:MAG: peptidylprolyl isomerase [Desulfovibrionaceae bacterium]|nr:peptidylprolyl isomerase [Desulfovibrionaceae bacterium]